MRGTQTKTLNPELDAEFGGRASLNATLADVDNRRSVSSMMGSGSGLDSAPSKKSQALAVKNWMEQNSGYWVLFVYNEQFVNRYMVPAVEFVRFFRATSTSPAHIAAAYEAARRYVVTLANDPDVRQMPCIQPANVQFLIPFSERTATDVRHVPTKLARLQARQDDVVAFRREDFKRAKDGDGSGGVMEESEFHIWKNNYLATKRTFDFNDTDPDAVPASVALRRSTVLCRNAYERLKARFGDLPKPVENDETDEVIDEAPVPCLDDDDDFVAAPIAAAVSSASAGSTEIKAPPPVLTTVPEKWTKPGVVKAFPESLRSPGAKFALAVFHSDWDLPADTPTYPEAAGMEWACVPFGGEYETEDEAQQVVLDQLNIFVRDASISCVTMNKPVCPTEVNEDAIKTTHRTDNTLGQHELNKVMGSRTNQLKDVKRARQFNAMGDRTVIPEVNANDDAVPDIDDDDAAVQAAAPAVILGVTQMTREEARARGDVAGDPVEAAFKQMAAERQKAAGGGDA